MKINYRPEIDGLRAISVIAVIIYHSQSLIFPEEFLSGGFIGVDIFCNFRIFNFINYF